MLLNPFRFGGAATLLGPWVNSAYSDVDPLSATATFSLGAMCGGGPDLDSGAASFALCDPAVASQFQAVCTLASGSFSGGGGSQTVNLATGHTWTVSRGTLGEKTATMNVVIQRISDGATMTSGSFTLTASREA